MYRVAYDLWLIGCTYILTDKTECLRKNLSKRAIKESDMCWNIFDCWNRSRIRTSSSHRNFSLNSIVTYIIFVSIFFSVFDHFALGFRIVFQSRCGFYDESCISYTTWAIKRIRVSLSSSRSDSFQIHLFLLKEQMHEQTIIRMSYMRMIVLH